jgi:hypothetical protein
MIKLKTRISELHSTEHMIRIAKKVLVETPYVVCPALNRRRVFTSKWFIALKHYKRSKKIGLQSLLPAIELIRSATLAQQNLKDESEWELIGETPCGHILRVHIREERACGNRLLFHISNYYKKKPH